MHTRWAFLDFLKGHTITSCGENWFPQCSTKCSTICTNSTSYWCPYIAECRDKWIDSLSHTNTHIHHECAAINGKLKIGCRRNEKKIVRLFFECVFADYWMCMRIWAYVSNGKTMNLHKPTFNHYYCLLHTRFSVYIVHLGDQKHTYCTNISNVAHI